MSEVASNLNEDQPLSAAAASCVKCGNLWPRRRARPRVRLRARSGMMRKGRPLKMVGVEASPVRAVVIED
jgi:hypothetical protein